MPVNCPQCGSPMSEASASSARCARHGAYTILFKRSAVDDGTIPLAQSALPPPPAGPSTLPYAQASYMPYAQVAVPQAALGPCQNHRQVAAVQRCTKCSARVCGVCDFSFPGDIHLCPRCVTSASGGISSGRRGMLIASFALAGAATFLLIVMILGFAGHFISRESAMLAGIIIISVAVCSVIGTGLGFGTINRQLANPISLWIAALWNGLLAGAMILLLLIGIIKGGK